MATQIINDGNNGKRCLIYNIHNDEHLQSLHDRGLVYLTDNMATIITSTQDGMKYGLEFDNILWNKEKCSQLEIKNDASCTLHGRGKQDYCIYVSKKCVSITSTACNNHEHASHSENPCSEVFIPPSHEDYESMNHKYKHKLCYVKGVYYNSDKNVYMSKRNGELNVSATWAAFILGIKNMKGTYYAILDFAVGIWSNKSVIEKNLLCVPIEYINIFEVSESYTNPNTGHTHFGTIFIHKELLKKVNNTKLKSRIYGKIIKLRTITESITRGSRPTGKEISVGRCKGTIVSRPTRNQTIFG